MYNYKPSFCRLNVYVCVLFNVIWKIKIIKKTLIGADGFYMADILYPIGLLNYQCVTGGRGIPVSSVILCTPTVTVRKYNWAFGENLSPCKTGNERN